MSSATAAEPRNPRPASTMPVMTQVGLAFLIVAIVAALIPIFWLSDLAATIQRYTNALAEPSGGEVSGEALFVFTPWVAVAYVLLQVLGIVGRLMAQARGGNPPGLVFAWRASMIIGVILVAAGAIIIRNVGFATTHDMAGLHAEAVKSTVFLPAMLATGAGVIAIAFAQFCLARMLMRADS